MADDVLTAAERNALLAARPSTVVPAGCSIPQPQLMSRKQSSDWCFSPPPLGDDLKRAISRVGQDWGQASAAALSTLLRRSVRVELAAVSQVAFREFAARMASPTCFNLLSAAPLAQHWMLEVCPSILYPAIDCMLGGGRPGASIAARPFTEIEQRLVGRVTNLLVQQLQVAWRPIAALDLAIERVTSSAIASATIPSSVPIVWMRFQVELMGVQGELQLGIPKESITSVFSTPDGGTGQDEAQPASPLDGEATIELVACLAQSQIAPNEVQGLNVGDVISTDQRVDTPIGVFENDILRFHGHAGALNGRKAVEIDEVTLPAENRAAADT